MKKIIVVMIIGAMLLVGCGKKDDTPSTTNDKVIDVVIVLMDITEKHERDKLRREFTANVSHELKTPLTAISGYAEIIMNGVAKKEDINDFSKSIYKEAQRLIELVKDLMLLSKLDEGSETLTMESVNLFLLSHNVEKRLKAKAKAKDVNIVIVGESVEIMGVASVLDEMLYNLVDNAIKYNKDGGAVKILIKRNNNEVILSVSDTGIGIPESLQDRVFERFYRIDKSHNELIPGTGLGLAIVKHGAALHNAKLDIKSNGEGGITITIIFNDLDVG